MKSRAAKYFFFLIAFKIGLGGVFLARTYFLPDPETFEAADIQVIQKTDLSPGDSPQILERDYEPSPSGAYFPLDGKGFERDTALVMDYFDDFKTGSIKIKDDFINTSLVINGNRVRLQTEKSRGIHYIFEGRFLKNGFKTRFADGETVLTGTLTKYRASKKIYSVSSKFLFASEVCAWNQNNR